MTHQKTEDRRPRTKSLSRLCRAVYVNVPLRGTQNFCLLSSVFCPLSSAFATEATRPAYTPPPAVSSGSLVQIIFSLLLVLAAIVLVAWLLKRMNMAQQGSGNLLKVLGTTSIGQRERIVLVEIKDTWLVVGVGSGQIRTLHTLDRPEDIAQQSDAHSPPAEKNKFAAILGNTLGQLANKKRHAP